MNITVILFRPKYPENVGSVARACMNMGCSDIIVVDPQMWDMEKALPLATVHARPLLESMRIKPDLATAVADFSMVYGTTARTGGWRKGIRTPEQAAAEMAEEQKHGGDVAIVFGPEDRGLTNAETDLCHHLLTIPTSESLTSLNLSQAVLVVLYECFKAGRTTPFRPGGGEKSRLITHQEREVLFSTLQETMLTIDYLHPDNPDYFMLPAKRFLNRMKLRLNEYNLLMGVCRQVKRIADIAGKKD
jgi:tRNA/rRNA methyltransferase